MGVDTPDVRRIIHNGPPADIRSYIQETGRGGRDGNLSAAILLKVSKYNRYCQKDIQKYMKNSTKCRRDILFQDTDNYIHIDMGKKCQCCDICKLHCNCESCEKFT